MAVTEELLKPAEVCRRLGMPSSTLRIYSTKFGELLSEGARKVVAGETGVGSHRLYNSRDLLVLTRGKELLGQGLTYDRALEELKLTMSLPKPSKRTEAPEASRGKRVVEEREDELGLAKEALETLRGAVSNESRALGMYKDLAETQARDLESQARRTDALAKELEAARERIARLEDAIEKLLTELQGDAERRRGIWDRLKGG